MICGSLRQNGGLLEAARRIRGLRLRPAYAPLRQLGADILERSLGHRQLAALLPQAVYVRRHLEEFRLQFLGREVLQVRNGDESAVHVISPSVRKPRPSRPSWTEDCISFGGE